MVEQGGYAQGRWFKSISFHKNGDCSSIGRASPCEGEGSGIVARHSPKRLLGFHRMIVFVTHRNSNMV